jgi:hypothetical protein
MAAAEERDTTKPGRPSVNSLLRKPLGSPTAAIRTRYPGASQHSGFTCAHRLSPGSRSGQLDVRSTSKEFEGKVIVAVVGVLGGVVATLVLWLAGIGRT